MDDVSDGPHRLGPDVKRNDVKDEEAQRIEDVPLAIVVNLIKERPSGRGPHRQGDHRAVRRDDGVDGRGNPFGHVRTAVGTART